MLKKLKGTSIKKILDTQEVFAIKGVGGGEGDWVNLLKKGTLWQKSFQFGLTFWNAVMKTFATDLFFSDL